MNLFKDLYKIFAEGFRNFLVAFYDMQVHITVFVASMEKQYLLILKSLI
jgi:hypothetical protein